jgi:hypothetical protein
MERSNSSLESAFPERLLSWLTAALKGVVPMLDPCAMKMHWGVDVQLQAVSVGECSASRAGHIASVETASSACWMGRWVVPIAHLHAMKEGKIFASASIRTAILQLSSL